MELNLLSLLLASLMPLVIGFVWYHEKVFGRTWMQAVGMTPEKMASGNMLKIFGGSFLLSIVLAFGLGIIATHDGFVSGALYYETGGTMNPDPLSESGKWLQYYKDNLALSNHTFQHGAFHGALIGGIFIGMPIFVIDGLFERHGFKYIAIKAGYWIITLALMAGIMAGMSK